MNLTLLIPLYPPTEPLGYIILSKLYLNNEISLFKKIKKLKSNLCSPYSVYCPFYITKDLNGEPLRWVVKEEIYNIMHKDNLDNYIWTRLAMRYIENLDDNHRIILCWS